MSNNFKDDFEKSSIDRHKFTSRHTEDVEKTNQN